MNNFIVGKCDALSHYGILKSAAVIPPTAAKGAVKGALKKWAPRVAAGAGIGAVGAGSYGVGKDVRAKREELDTPDELDSVSFDEYAPQRQEIPPELMDEFYYPEMYGEEY